MVEYMGQVPKGSVSPVVERTDARPGPTLCVQFYGRDPQANKPGEQALNTPNLYVSSDAYSKLGHKYIIVQG